MVTKEKGVGLMAETLQVKPGLTGNQLKILAMIAMTCDHVGLQLLPKVFVLRLIGRLALPIYAYMIAEGCRYTRDRKNYLLRLVSLAAVCQVVYFFAMGSLYQCILVTFSLSVGLIYLMDSMKAKIRWGRLSLAVWAVFFLCEILPELLPGTDFAIDYGITGVLLPVMIYAWNPVRGLVTGLVLMGLQHGGFQWYALAAIPLLMLYNGQRGKWKIGKLFYFYYPAHLVVIYLISLLL